MTTLRALIIDDQPQNILVLKQLLGIEGIEVVEISNPKNLEDFEQMMNETGAVDILFIDLEMPIFNGYQVLNMMKEHPNFVSSKKVAYSVHLDEVDNSFDAGFDAFLGKPIDAESFPENLQRLLAGENLRFTF